MDLKLYKENAIIIGDDEVNIEVTAIENCKAKIMITNKMELEVKAGDILPIEQSNIQARIANIKSNSINITFCSEFGKVAIYKELTRTKIKIK